jgi:hypothetical protein
MRVGRIGLIQRCMKDLADAWDRWSPRPDLDRTLTHRRIVQDDRSPAA